MNVGWSAGLGLACGGGASTDKLWANDLIIRTVEADMMRWRPSDDWPAALAVPACGGKRRERKALVEREPRQEGWILDSFPHPPVLTAQGTWAYRSWALSVIPCGISPPYIPPRVLLSSPPLWARIYYSSNLDFLFLKKRPKIIMPMIFFFFWDCQKERERKKKAKSNLFLLRMENLFINYFLIKKYKGMPGSEKGVLQFLFQNDWHLILLLFFLKSFFCFFS